MNITSTELFSFSVTGRIDCSKPNISNPPRADGDEWEWSAWNYQKCYSGSFRADFSDQSVEAITARDRMRREVQKAFLADKYKVNHPDYSFRLEIKKNGARVGFCQIEL